LGLRGQTYLEAGAKVARFRVSSFALLTQYYSGDKIEDKEMGGTCGTYREE